ncbi:RES family NAD+ phosphorylase [Reichenbachiella sp.]|uniref:RES family NAD+ phosphorylase n=1 Tax=Reichenbachiella sp. TaxID=2184521 RepID=UPI00329A6ED9
MILYRITTKPYINDLSGTGAMLYGGRWNAKGQRMIYTSESLSLAMLEIMANLSSKLLGRSFYCVELELPKETVIETLQVLPDQWNAYPYTLATIEMGNDFLKGGGACLKVPSASIPSEFNYLLNPLHDDFRHLKVVDARPIMFDHRLMD